MGLRDWLMKRRYGGETGLNEMGNNAKMTAVIAGPFFVAWIFVQMFLPEEYIDIGIMMLFISWIGYCILIYAGAKSDANNYRAFPQPVWRFTDGGMVTFNKMLVAPDSHEKVCEFKEGGVGYHVFFEQKFQYHEKGMPFPFVFDSAWWKLPDLWDQSFAFSSGGEFFHKGIAVEHPACESISVYVIGWEKNKDGKWEPICLINDCSLMYNKVIENSKKIDGDVEFAEIDRYEMLFNAERESALDLLAHTEILEETLAVMSSQSKDIKKQVDNTMENIRKRVHLINDTSEGIFKRYFNFRNVLKVVVITIIVLFASHWFLGWP